MSKRDLYTPKEGCSQDLSARFFCAILFGRASLELVGADGWESNAGRVRLTAMHSPALDCYHSVTINEGFF
jgi:hypothetical protein